MGIDKIYTHWSAPHTYHMHFHPFKSEEEKTRVAYESLQKKVVARSQPSTPEPGKKNNASRFKKQKRYSQPSRTPYSNIDTVCPFAKHRETDRPYFTRPGRTS
jgi:hypothetical protein